jgi:GMP synthase (glutamine-hydrolysing)
MDPLLIVKTGNSPFPNVAREGDFEDWIVEGMGIDPERVMVVSVFEGAELPQPVGLAGVVITGSAAMVSHREPWSESAAQWLATAVACEVPILGICYGHQLLAQALGGRVGINPLGREMGTVAVRLEDSAEEDGLLAGFSGSLSTQATHVESVLELPDGAIRLGATDRDPNSAFSIGASAWGVQFHPEFCATVMSGYIEERRDLLRDEGVDVDERLREVVDCPDGPALLRRFAELIQS